MKKRGCTENHGENTEVHGEKSLWSSVQQRENTINEKYYTELHGEKFSVALCEKLSGSLCNKK
jgi:hypothetical protein